MREKGGNYGNVISLPILNWRFFKSIASNNHSINARFLMHKKWSTSSFANLTIFWEHRVFRRIYINWFLRENYKGLPNSEQVDANSSGLSIWKTQLQERSVIKPWTWYKFFSSYILQSSQIYYMLIISYKIICRINTACIVASYRKNHFEWKLRISYKVIRKITTSWIVSSYRKNHFEW